MRNPNTKLIEKCDLIREEFAVGDEKKKTCAFVYFLFCCSNDETHHLHFNIQKYTSNTFKFNYLLIKHPVD